MAGKLNDPSVAVNSRPAANSSPEVRQVTPHYKQLGYQTCFERQGFSSAIHRRVIIRSPVCRISDACTNQSGSARFISGSCERWISMGLVKFLGSSFTFSALGVTLLTMDLFIRRVATFWQMRRPSLMVKFDALFQQQSASRLSSLGVESVTAERVRKSVRHVPGAPVFLCQSAISL